MIQQGDVVALCNSDRLYDVGIGHLCGREARITRQLTYSEIDSHPKLRGAPSWWFTLTGDGTSYYAPESCFRELLISRDPPCSTTKSVTLKGKEPIIMALFAVTFLKTPSVKAQEAGEVETIVVPSTEVVAHEQNAAIALAAADHANDILALKANGAKLRVIIRNLG